jgi:hypothetical protein
VHDSNMHSHSSENSNNAADCKQLTERHSKAHVRRDNEG